MTLPPKRSPSVEIIEKTASPHIEIVERQSPRDLQEVINLKKRKNYEWDDYHFKKSRRDPELLQDKIRLLKSENRHLADTYRHISNENKYWREKYCILE